MSTLPKKLIMEIDLATQFIRPMDLYRALKFVGDDLVKNDINSMLREVLDEATYNKVVAVFKICTET